MRLDGDQGTAGVSPVESGGVAGVPTERKDERGLIEEQFRVVKERMAGEAPDTVELEREARESIDPDLPYKRKFDPTFGYFADRMEIDPHEVSFHYELSVRAKDADERAEPFRQRFTNFHDLREAVEQNKEHGTSVVELKLPPEFLERMEKDGNLRKFADGFGILKQELETNTTKVNDRYAEAAASGELARLKEKDAHKRDSATDAQSMGTQQQALRTELGIRDAVERAKNAVPEKELAPEMRERELRNGLNLRRSVYVGGENSMRAWEKKNKWFWDRRKLERSVKRAALASVLHPGDAEVPTRAGASMDALQEVAERENTFRDRLREQGITKEADIRQIYTLEQHKVEYEYARTALAMYLKKTETERFTDGDSGAEHAKEFARAKVYDELFVQESLTLNRMKLEAWPAAEKGKVRQAWESWRAWNGKLKPWQRAGMGVGVAAGVAGAGALFGVWGASFAVGYAGRRAAGAIAGAFGGTGAGKLMDKYLSKRTQAEVDRLDVREQKLKEDMRELVTVDPESATKALMGLNQEYQSIMDARYGIAKRRAMAKAAATVVGGFALGAGTSYAAAHMGGLDALMPIKPSAEHAPNGPKSHISTIHDAKPTPEPVHTPEAPNSPEAVAGAPVRAVHVAEQPPLGVQLEELATVKKGEGAWGPVRRQLRAQLTAHPDQFGLKPEDLQNGAKVQHALNSRTTQILKDLGFIGPKGTTQLGIHPPGTKIILESNGGLRIEGGNAYDYGVHPHSTSVAEAVPAKNAIVPEAQPETHAMPTEGPASSDVSGVESTHLAEVPVEHAPAVSEPTAPVAAGHAPAPGGAPGATEAAAPAAVEGAVNVQEGAALHAAVMQEVTAHYADQFNGLSPLGKECFVYSLEHQVAMNHGRTSVTDILSDPDWFRMDMSIAKAVSAVSPDELAALQPLGFTKESLFTINHGDYSYAVTLRDMHVSNFLKTLAAEQGGVDTSKLGKTLNFVLSASEGNKNSAILIGERHLALAEKLADYVAHGGKPDISVAEALIAP